MKRYLFVVGVCALLFTSAGCSTKSEATNPSQSEPASTSTITNQAQKPVEQPQKINEPKNQVSTQNSDNHLTVKLYFPDKQGLNVSEKSRDIRWSAPETKYQAVFKELTQVPDQGLVAPWKGQNAKINFENGIVTIDLEKSIQAGSTEEHFLVLTLLQTMFQFQEVNQVQLLINGKPAETLSGHLGVEQPFTRKTMGEL